MGCVVVFVSILCFFIFTEVIYSEILDYKTEYKKICHEFGIKRPSPKQVELIDEVIRGRQQIENEREERFRAERNLTEANQEIGKLKNQQEKDQYLKFCDVAREEIDNLDEYAYAARDNNGQEFSYDMKLINGKQGYFEQKTERRRQRILFALEYSTHYVIQELKQRMGNIKNDVFADKISRAYEVLSKAVHGYVYTPGFHGNICYHITQNKSYNKYLNILLEDFDWDVGKMQRKTTKK